MKPIAVIAIGGNSLARPGQRGTFEEQQRNAVETCQAIADVIQAGYRVVMTHGNGPQVGQALLRGELSQPSLPPLRLDECDAETEGSIGYLLEQTLENVLAARGIAASVGSLITQVMVDSSDPAFDNPTKPIGPFYRFEEALERKQTLGWRMVEDSGRGWRRVVPSPRPLEILELPAIQAGLDAGVIVIAAGGGGIPVVRRAGCIVGIEAVIDKDRVSALLARNLDAALLLFSTGVDQVYWHYGRVDQRPLDTLTCEDAWRYLQEGEFPAGSMGPKIEAAIEYLEAGGSRVVITSPRILKDALAGRSGTEIMAPVVAEGGGRSRRH
ncbi:MAG: carbamate kinase [Acidobacteria bacterium]|nr:carbamate kinase [Acidobacteriota bacterium]